MDAMDILTPEFMQLAEKAKAIYDMKVKEGQLFKALYQKHREKMVELEKQAEELKAEYTKAVKAKSDAVANEKESE